MADHYDVNTRRFLRFGESTSNDAIHRGVWMPGVTNTAEAADTVNRLLIERSAGHVPAGEGRVLDLGCGVGATVVRLAHALDAQVNGVTISRVQVEIAEQRLAAEGLAERCRIIHGDFTQLPAEPLYHAMVAIESVVHAPSLPELIASVAARLYPGGRLILCDDWMTDKDRGLAARERCLEQFRAGWRRQPAHRGGSRRHGRVHGPAPGRGPGPHRPSPSGTPMLSETPDSSRTNRAFSLFTSGGGGI